MNPTILSPAMSKLCGRLGYLIVVGQPVYEKKNFEFKPVKLHIRIDLVSNSACVGRLVNI